MITFERSYKVGDGLYATMEEAQQQALGKLLAPELGPDGITATADAILKHKDEIVNVLTMTEKALPRARKVNGGTKRRKTTATETPAANAA